MMSPCPSGTSGALGDTDPGGPMSLCVPTSSGDTDPRCPCVPWGHQEPLGTWIWVAPCLWGHWEPLGTRILDVPMSLRDIGSPWGHGSRWPRVALCPHIPWGQQRTLGDTDLGRPHVPYGHWRTPGDRDPRCPHVALCPLIPWGHGSKMSPCPLGTSGALGDTDTGGPMSLCVPMPPGDTDLGWPHVPGDIRSAWGHRSKMSPCHSVSPHPLGTTEDPWGHRSVMSPRPSVSPQ